ncbi:hypothetical protein T492DRAFT_1054868 [Pavlovales sp. CCMP2436]|nr:hypothetical protein T492DRAFT_1054868 [Pavlovales sp. CCMP2436]|mmetsp:Transcript_5618/g.14044  ORF Transcript_5618/g.14044 Transcript_5618/m.14044 type:complete len:271 (+) Transcript_5618:33-845(+)
MRVRLPMTTASWRLPGFHDGDAMHLTMRAMPLVSWRLSDARRLTTRSSVGCPFEELGIRPGASTEQVKVAYRASAKKWHPDAYRGKDERVAAVRFRAASDAYATILRDAHGGETAAGNTTAAGGTTRDGNGQGVWRRRYARPGASQPREGQDAANYWRDRARATRPEHAHEASEFYVPPAGHTSRGRLIVGPILFAVGLGVCVYYASAIAPEARTPQTSGAEQPGDTVDAIYNTKRRRWERPHASLYNDPQVVSMIRQQPAAAVFQPPKR